MKTIAVSNRKGGVGKTSVASNIADAIRRTGIGTLLIDMDSQCDLTKIYLEEGHKFQTIQDVLEGKCTFDEAILEVRKDLYLIPGGKNLDELNLKKSPQLLKRLLHKSRWLKDGGVEVIIIDTPPAVNDAVTTAYAAANHVLIVTQPETFGLDNMSLMIQEITRLKKEINNQLNLLGIAVNKVDSRRTLAKFLEKKLRKIFYGYVFESSISYNTAVPKSQNEKLHISELGWQGKNVKEFRSLAYEILIRMGMLDDNGSTAEK